MNDNVLAVLGSGRGGLGGLAQRLVHDGLMENPPGRTYFQIPEKAHQSGHPSVRVEFGPPRAIVPSPHRRVRRAPTGFGPVTTDMDVISVVQAKS